MDLGIMMRGILLGFSIAAPVGPIGVLCIRRTLAGRPAGLASGLGAASADAIYGAIAPFGVTWLTGMLVSQQSWIRLVGGIFMIVLGVRTFMARPAERSAAFRSRFNAKALAWVNRFSGTIIAAFGVVALASVAAPGGKR